ncbi:hypothetical protein TNCV_3258381 [Trichonephila clavipes]|nr:hypothetical protein TNCV_3258381 [Trichonephila clavipes]
MMMPVSKRTVQRSLHHIGFVMHRPMRVPLLNVRHRAPPLALAKRQRDWSIENWFERISSTWSDECRF